MTNPYNHDHPRPATEDQIDHLTKGIAICFAAVLVLLFILLLR